MKIFFLLVFAISSIIHLYASLKSNKKLRAYTKGFILAGLFGWYCCSASPVIPIVCLAIATSWLGDMLLIPHGTKWFAAGGISFLASHMFFALAYMLHIDFAVIPVWAIIAIAAVYFGIACLVFRGLRPHLPKELFYPMFVYLLTNGTMNCFAFYQLLSVPCTATIITFVGAVLFFISDSVLFYVRFKKDTVFKNHFPVMLTYVIGEFLIVWGLVLIGA